MILPAALETAPRFGLKQVAARKILREVLIAVNDWRKTAKQLRLKAGTIETYVTAFEHPLRDEAGRLV